jgi:hypothetical protein
MTARGLAVIHVPPSSSRAGPDDVIDEFAQAVDVRSGGPAPPVVLREAG